MEKKKTHRGYYKKKSQVFFFFLQECNLCSFQLIFKTRFKGMSKVYIDVRMSVILTLDTDDFRTPPHVLLLFLILQPQSINGLMALHILCSVLRS